MGHKLPPGQLELYKKLDEILLTEWDPIGVGGIAEARDEYHAYLPHVFRLALQGESENKIAEYLLWVETERMGLSGDRLKCKRIAGVILRTKKELGL